MKNLLLSIVFFQAITLTAQEAYSSRSESFYFYENNRISIKPETGAIELKSKEGTYIISKEYGIEYLIILWDDKSWDKYLMLRGWGVLCLYEKNGEPYFYGARFYPDGENYGWRIPHFVANEISASSSLREGNRIYSVENINNRIDEAWAEGVAGNGIGERIFIHLSPQSFYAISIGYISYTKPNLYMENSRPKKIRATFDDIHFIDIELEDTPDFQSINFRDLYSYGKVESDILILEIINVYPGTKYTDTCINAIISEFSQ